MATNARQRTQPLPAERIPEQNLDTWITFTRACAPPRPRPPCHRATAPRRGLVLRATHPIWRVFAAPERVDKGQGGEKPEGASDRDVVQTEIAEQARHQGASGESVPESAPWPPKSKASFGPT